MPISTDDEGWQNADAGESIHQRILDFLNEHPDEAFHYRELADEIVDTSWSEAHDEEWNPPGDRDREAVDTIEEQAESIMDQVLTNKVMGAADQLVYEGQLEKRIVAAEDTNLPYKEWEDVVFYTTA